MLSIMTITRERLTNHSGRETGGRGDARPCERPDKRLWHFYREYAGGGRINDLTGAVCPCLFGFVCDIMNLV